MILRLTSELSSTPWLIAVLIEFYFRMEIFSISGTVFVLIIIKKIYTYLYILTYLYIHKFIRICVYLSVNIHIHNSYLTFWQTCLSLYTYYIHCEYLLLRPPPSHSISSTNWSILCFPFSLILNETNKINIVYMWTSMTQKIAASKFLFDFFLCPTRTVIKRQY